MLKINFPIISAECAQLIKRIKSNRTRNIFRSILLGKPDKNTFYSNLNRVRKIASQHDLNVIGQIIAELDSALDLRCKFPFYSDIYRTKTLDYIESQKEVAFVCGHINGNLKSALEIIEDINFISDIVALPSVEAVKKLRAFATKWGASNFLIKKIAFIFSRDKKKLSNSEDFEWIRSALKQNECGAPFYAALEAVDPDFSFLSGMNVRVNNLGQKASDNFRSILPLHNIVGTPVTLKDSSHFLSKSFSLSLVDEILAIRIFMLLKDMNSEVFISISNYLNNEILKKLYDLDINQFNPEALYRDFDAEENDFRLFRTSLAFLEFAPTALYRNFVDRTISTRFLRSFFKRHEFQSYKKIPSKRELTQPLSNLKSPDTFQNVGESGTFLRTLWFLEFISIKENIASLSVEDILFIFESTTSLDILLSAEEMELLYSYSNDDTRILFNLLSMALHKSQNSSEDVDFMFRMNFADLIKKNFNSSIHRFFETLVPHNKNIAQYMASILDVQTLRKLYTLVSTSDEALQIRNDFLRYLAKELEVIELYVEADEIEAQLQIAKLRDYFDESRIYVDGISMKKWFLETPNAYVNQLKYNIEHNIDVVNSAPDGAIIIFTELRNVLMEVTQGFFKEFCLNADFGIEAYLGRRIRHNTLSGMMREGIEDIINQRKYDSINVDSKFKQSLELWQDKFDKQVDLIRKEFLQFKSQNKPNGLLTTHISFENDVTSHSFSKLITQCLNSRSLEICYEMIFRFCWEEIDPQLKNAVKIITIDLLGNAMRSLSECFSGFDDEVHNQFLADVREKLNEKYSLLGSWFTQPQDGFIPASIRMISELIVRETTNTHENPVSIEGYGDAFELMLYGQSVHKIYDCLSVTIRNAINHGDTSVPIKIKVAKIEDRPIPAILVSVKSKMLTEKLNENKAKIIRLFNEDDLEASMAREGYSGIKKLRFITKKSEGLDTVKFDFDDDCCEIEFYLTIQQPEENL